MHEGGFVCEKADDGKIVFRDQRKRILNGEPHCASIGAIGLPPDYELQRWLDSAFVDDDIDSSAARWYAGEQIDWNLAVGNLFSPD